MAWAKVLRAITAAVLLGSLGLVPAGAPPVAADVLWTVQNAGTNGKLEDIAAIDATTAWAVGQAVGAILKTTNGGTTWAHQSIPDSLNAMPIYGVAAVDATNAWAVGYGGLIVRTPNGSGWGVQTSNTLEHLRAVAVANATTLWAVGDGGTILKTINSGDTWGAQNSNTTLSLSGVAVAPSSPDVAWAVGGNGTILKTVDGGTNWTAQNSTVAPALTDVTAVDANTAWAVGAVGTILKTTNGGSTWTAQLSSGLDLDGVAALNHDVAWAVGSGGRILRTVDGGTAWILQGNGAGAEGLGAVAALDVNTAWAVGNGGKILKGSLVPTAFSYSVSVLSVVICVQTTDPIPPTINYGSLALNSTKVSPQLTVKNCGNVAENFLIQGTDATATVSGESNWTLGLSPGANTYVHSHGPGANGPFAALITPTSELTAGMLPGGTWNFYTRIQTPTSTTGDGVRNTAVTVTAVSQ